ncbi:MAG: ABC transporter permease [Thaumarchaeota archaeon 13_1_40CM_2_39_13_2]|nr:MAG: ABC transporter permease [Thaumarchaeota archaeon 13_1_40CM_2_39_13_2]OLE43685.1 MAG: ABC transporter permease [Thaumarchaeota archaeon 13_1_20CM_2_39_11]
MDYRAQIGIRFITRRKGSLIAASLAVAIAILVVQVNSVIFQGLYDAIVRDLTNYRFGHVYITRQEDFIKKPAFVLVNWLERIPYVQAAAPRIDYSAQINSTVNGQLIKDYQVPVIGVDPVLDKEASTMYQTVEGQYVSFRNSIVLGAITDRDLGYPQIGDTVKLKFKDQHGNDVLKRFTIVGITKTAGSVGLDNSVIVNIDTLREIIDRPQQTQSILVRLNDPTKDQQVRDLFLSAFPSSADKFKAQTIEESAELTLSGFRSGIALINLVGYFGMMSSAFAVVTIQMMQVTSKTRDIGVMRAIGSKRKDVLLVFIFQGMVIGAIGAGLGTALGVVYTVYAKETHLTFQGSLALEVKYNWMGIAQTDILAFVLAIVASIYPAYKATKLEPVEAMRVG